MIEQPVFDVTSAITVLNQTLEYAYPTITVVGELSELKVSRDKWLYFDIKDESSKLKCFGTVFQQRMPLQDGMRVEVVARPKLHNLYGFSLNVVSVRPIGEGSIKQAAKLLHDKLQKEGLFSIDRKRSIPFAPARIALVASGQSAGFGDFIKILNERWPYLNIDHYEVSVQGLQAEEEIVKAINIANQQAEPAEVLVLIRGGGSADDLAVFSTENVARAVSSSRIPTLVAIGHEQDVALAELVADVRASTPSNAVEVLVPDRKSEIIALKNSKSLLAQFVNQQIELGLQNLVNSKNILNTNSNLFIKEQNQNLNYARTRLNSYHPKQVLKRGYAIVRYDGKLLDQNILLKEGNIIQVELEQVDLEAKVLEIKSKD